MKLRFTSDAVHLTALLLFLGSSCNKPSKPNVSLHLAAKVGNLEQTQANLAWGAEVNEKDPSGRTPLHVAVEGDNLPIIQLLLENGARVDLADNQGLTPLHLATFRGSLASMKSLIDSGSQLDCRAVGFGGATPLHIAAGVICPAGIKLLLDRGASLEVLDDHGARPLDWTKDWTKHEPVPGEAFRDDLWLRSLWLGHEHYGDPYDLDARRAEAVRLLGSGPASTPAPDNERWMGREPTAVQLKLAQNIPCNRWHHPSLSLSMEYPAGWTVKDGVQADTVVKFVDPDRSQGITMIVLSSYELGTATNFNTIDVDDFLRAALAPTPPMEVVIRRGNRTRIGGLSAIEADAECEIAGSTLYTFGVWVLKGTTLWAIRMTNDHGRPVLDGAFPVFYRASRSFSLE